MAWITPKTDWTEADRCTAADMNRIAGNLTYLTVHTDGTNPYSNEMYVLLTDWHTLTNKAIALAAMVGIGAEPIDDRCTADNFNKLEALIEKLKQPIDLRFKQSLANRYAGQIIIGGGTHTGGRK